MNHPSHFEKSNLKLLFKEAKRLLTEQGWTKNHLARDSSGICVSVYSDDATCFCALGALERTWKAGYKAGYISLAAHYLTLAIYDIGGGSSVANFNDDPKTKQEDILKAIDLAILKVDNETWS